MKIQRSVGCLILCTAIGLISPASWAQDRPVKPDNTRANRDDGQTADQQGMNKQDRDLTQHLSAKFDHEL